MGFQECGERAFSTQLRVRAGHALFRAGERFESLYVVRQGFFKSCVGAENGTDQVTGFHMAGDLVGLDGIATEQHARDVVALEDSTVFVLPYSSMETPDLRRKVQAEMSREIRRGQDMMLLLGTMDAEQRMVAFLLDLSQRLHICGQSPSEFCLRMNRAEIGS